MTSYQHARLEDVRDLFAYLKTLPPVRGKVRDHDVPFPFNIRRNIGIWKFLFMDGKPFVADAAKSPQWNRGAYLVNSLGHCAECHSPRNALGGIIGGAAFCRRPQSGRRGLGAQHHAEAARRLEREGHRLFSQDRRIARRRQRQRRDGARDPEHFAIAARGSRGDGGPISNRCRRWTGQPRPKRKEAARACIRKAINICPIRPQPPSAIFMSAIGEAG